MHDEPAIALIGHELHHAWEIAQARWVVDDQTLIRLYRQIGHDGAAGARAVDTRAARDAGRFVRAELRAFGDARLLPADVSAKALAAVD